MRRLLSYAGVILVIFLFLRVYGNRQYYKGEDAGRKYMSMEIERQKAAEWKAKEEEIARAAAAVDIERRAVGAAFDQLSRERYELSRTLRDGLAQIQRERMKDYESAAAVSDDQLWDAIREISGQLAAHP